MESNTTITRVYVTALPTYNNPPLMSPITYQLWKNKYKIHSRDNTFTRVCECVCVCLCVCVCPMATKTELGESKLRQPLHISHYFKLSPFFTLKFYHCFRKYIFLVRRYKVGGNVFTSTWEVFSIVYFTIYIIYKCLQVLTGFYLGKS